MVLKLVDPAAAPGQAPAQGRRFLGWCMVMLAVLVDFVAVGFLFYA